MDVMWILRISVIGFLGGNVAHAMTEADPWTYRKGTWSGPYYSPIPVTKESTMPSRTLENDSGCERNGILALLHRPCMTEVG